MPQRIDVPGVGLVDFPDDMGDDQIIRAAAELHRQATLPQMPKLNTVFVQGAGDLIGPPPPPEGPVDLPMTDADRAKFNESIRSGRSVVPAMSAANTLSGSVSAALQNFIPQGIIDALVSMEKGVPRGAVQNVSGFIKTAGATDDLLQRHMPDGLPNTSTASVQGALLALKKAGVLPANATVADVGKIIDEKVEGAFPRDKNHEFAGSVGEGVGQVGSAILMPFLRLGAGEELAAGAVLPPLAKRVATAGAESALTMFGAEFSDAYDRAIERGDDPDTGFAKSLGYASLAAAIENKFGAGRLAKKLVGEITPKAVDRLVKSGITRSAIFDFLSNQGKDAVLNFGEEAAQRLAQDLIIDGKPQWDQIFQEGAVGGVVAALVGLPANIHSAAKWTGPQREARYQWDKAVTEARVDQAVRLEDEATPKPVRDTRIAMEHSALIGDDSALAKSKAALAKLAGQPVADATETEINLAKQKFTENLQAISEPEWRKTIESENFTPDQYELRPGKGYKDNLTGRATDQPTDADGRLNQEIEGVYDQQTKKVVFFRGSIRDPQRLREVARHEGLHQAAGTPEGQAKISEFTAQEIGRSQEMRDDVWKLARRYNGRDIPEEYLAHLYEEKKWWREPVDRLRAKLSEWFPKLGPAPAPVAGRILARSIVRNKEVIPNGQEVQSQVQDQEVTQPVPPVLDAAGTAPGTASTPAPAAPAASRITPEASSLLESVRRGGIPMGWTRNLQKIAADNGFSVTPTATPNDLIAHLERLEGTAAPAASPQRAETIPAQSAPPVEPKVEAAQPAPATPQKDERPFDGGVNRPRSDEPPIAEGKVRVYHGGGFKEAAGDWTPSRDYAEGYALMNGGNVWYVDLESDSPLLKPAYDDTGLPRRAAPAHFSGTAETRDNAKSLGPPKPAAPVSEPTSEPTQETKPSEAQATDSNKAPSVETKSETNSVLQPTPQEKAVAQSIGLSDGKWEIRSGVAYQDNLTGRATYDVRDANGKPNRAIEGFYDLTSKKIVILRSGITGNRADVRGKTTEERKEDHLRIILARSILSRKPKPSEPVPKPSEAPSEPTAETPAEPSASDLAKEAEAKRKREDAQKAQDEAIAKDERTADNEPPEPTPTPKEEAKIQKKKEQADLQAELDAELGQTETDIRRGTVGGMLSSGEVVLTKSGRRTTPFPKLNLQTDRGTTRTVKAVDRWLMQNAYDEAVVLGDAFAARNFKANIESPTQSDKDLAEEYLFGDSPVAQPNGSILKPIGQTETPEPTKDQGGTTATDSVESKGRTLATNIRTRLINGETVAKADIATEGLTAKEAEEWAELGATEAARAIARGPGTNVEKFDRLVDLYQRMPSQSTRTLETKVGQQYSTPPPLAFAGAVLANFGTGRSFVDPTAGHGMLAIGMPQGSRLLLNELDPERRGRLSSVGGIGRTPFGTVPENVTLTGEDATTEDFHDRVADRRPDRVGLNPPFGSVVEGKGKKQFPIFNGVTTTDRTQSIDIAISLNTLDGMAPDGQAFVIIGSKTGTPTAEFSKNPESRAKSYERPVFLEFFERFNVVDWFTIGGDLYRRMGAGWPVDMIVIRGKGKTPASVVRPWQTPPRVINSWEELRALIPNEQQPAITTPEPGGPADTSGNPDRPADRRPPVPLPAPGKSGGGGGVRVKPPSLKRPAGRGAVNPGNGQPAGVSGTGGGAGVPAGGTGGTGVPTPPGNAQPDKPLAGPTTGGGGGQAPVGAGGGGLPQPSPGPVNPKSSEFGSKNKLVTRERAEELRRLLREKLGRTSTGIDPTILANSIELGAYYLEGGIRKFSDWAKAMIEDLGPTARPWLRSVYEGARAFPGEQYSGDMDSPEVVKMLAQQLTEAETITPPEAPKVATPQALSADTLVPYTSVSTGKRLPLVAPRNMADQMMRALLELQEKVGPLDDYVAGKLGRPVEVLQQQMAASQIEALANAIYNIENGGALIVADETGVGKGRVVAGLIEYALRHNRIPVFVTAKKGLYSDMVGRDLVALGNTTFKPWITDTSYAYIDGKGNRVVRKSAQDLPAQMDSIARSGELPSGFHGLFTTYDQLKADRPKGFKEDKKDKAARKRQKDERPDGPKWNLLRQLAPNSIIILDESHLAAGADSETNLKFLSVLKRAAGVYFSSATWSKRPDTMGLYAVATSMRLSGLTDEQIADAISKGGVPMQQAVASMLASNGELMRRQQDWTGIEFKFKTSAADSAREVESADNYTGFIANLMELAKVINSTAKNRVRSENQVRPEEVKVKLEPMQFGSRLFNLSTQYLLSLRVGATVREAVAALQAGEKPWISLFNTMEGPIQDLQAMGLPLTFNGMLLREMEKMLVITVKDPLARDSGGVRKVRLKPEELADGGALYYQIKQAVEETNLGSMPVSPIDAIKKGVAAAGFTIGEITARDGTVEENGGEVVVTDREKVARDILLAGFNGDPKYPDAPRFDAMIVNASSGTGLSAHTDPAFTDQRQRHGIIAQPDPDVNGFMQMIGRLNRSGQNSKPKYTVITTSLAAERRFATMLRGKMASLNANTTADAESEMTKGSVATDVFNEVGDGVVHRVLSANASLADQMGFKLDPKGDPDDGFARNATGYFVMLRNADAERLWKLISSEYNDEINRMDEQGTNPLKAEAEDLRARLVERTEVGGGHGKSPFDQPVFLEKTEVRPPLKPATWAQAVDKAGSNRNDLVRRAREWISRSRDVERQRTRDAATPDLAARLQDNHNEARQAVGEAVQMLGETFGIDPLGTGTPLFHGVVVDVRLKDTDPSDYSSRSRQELVLWTNTYRRKFTIPLSKVEIGKTGSLLIPMESYIAENAFDSNAEKDTTRFMMTGNLLSAWELAQNQSQGKARVAIYTRDDGSIATGIIMPPGWSGTGKAQKIIESAEEFERVLRDGTTVTSLPTSSVHPIEINGLDLTLPANSRAKAVWGDRRFKDFFTYQPQQRGSVFIGQLNSHEIGNLFEYLKGKGVRLAKDLPSQPGQKFSIIPTETREALVNQDIQWLRTEYKSAPEVVTRINPEEGRGGQSVYYDPGFRQIVVVPRLLPRTRGARRSLFLGALADAGINLIPEAFWDAAWEDIRKVDPEMLKRAADALKVDVREHSGRREVLRRLVEQRMQGPTRYGLVRSLLRMFRAESPTARVVDRVARQIAKQSENFIPETPYTFAPDSQEQVHADVNAAVWGLRSDVYALRDAANEVISRAIEDNQWQRIKNRLGELAEQGESASIGRGRRIRLNIDSPQFIAELEALQVPHNQSDVQAHHTWLDELEARRVVTLMDNLDKNRETLGFLDENLRTGSGDLTKQSSSVIEALKSRIARQQARLDRIETEKAAIFDRANSIRRATDGLAEARAARATLTAPEIQPWIETIYEIERSGAIPRGMDEVSPSLRTPIEVASGLFGHHALEIQRSMRERMDRVSERLAKNLRKLQQRRRELRSKQGEVDVRVHELLTSIAGDAEASGGLFSRSVAQQVRERELAISRLAVFLGQAQPNSLAAEFTEALTSGDIFAAMGSATPGELPAGAPSQERPVASDEAFGRNVAMIRDVAQGASITEDVLREILDMANRDLGFRNVVLMLADEADARSERRMLDVIERVEAARASMLAHPQPLNAEERATREGFIAARGMLERLRLERSGASATLAEVEKEIQEAEIEQRSIAMLHQLAARAVELAGGEMGDRIGTAEMVYRTNSRGLHFMEFVKADGTKQEGFTIGPNTEYTAEVIQKIIEWRQAAQEAVEEAQANPTNPPNAPHITRGLAVGAEKALGAIDAYSTPDNLLKTSRYKIFNLWLAKTEFAIRAILPRLIPGIHGRLFAESIAGYARLGRLLDAIAAKNHARRMKLLRSAYESLGLDPYNANHQSDLATAYAEVAHRYREHGSKVAVGDTLLHTSLRNKPITRELVTLLRFDRDLFREAQRIMQAEDYGGIRENLRGIRLVRPAAETGDIGLARKVNSEIERQIAANYEAALAADPKNPDMSQTWVAFPDIVRFHILDSLRSDLAFERNPMLLELEQQYSRDIRSGKVPPPSIASAFEDTVSALAVYANNRISSPHETIRKALSDELMVYARVARSRRASSVDSTTPMTRVGTYTGEDDTNEFTSPAAKLIYPSSMYEYGASGSVNDMRGALSNVLDVSQVSMLGSGKAAAEHLRTIADILKNTLDPRMNDEVRAVARWFTNSGPDVDVTQEVANSAATKVRAVAEAIERDLAHIQSPSVSPGVLQKFTGALMPFMLAAPRVGLSNVVGGPLSSRRILTPLIGAPLANLAAFGLTLHSLSYAVYNMTDWMVRKTVGIHLPRLGTSPEVMEWLQSIGWGSRIGYAELEGLKAHMGGGVANSAIRRIGQVGDVLESTVGSKVGTTGTDAHLNRMAATTLVPLMLRRMTSIANSWRNRLAKANIEVSGDVTGEWAIGDADIGNSADFREMLRESGVHPEEFMAALARGDIDRRRFWLHPMGAKFANAVLSEWNASTRTNRPSARGLRSLLLGWMTFEVSRTVDMFRQPVDRSATRKLMNTAITAGSMLLSSFAIYYFGVAVRQAMNDTQTTIARELAEAIASPPDDDDDLWDWIQNLLARFVSAWEINSAPQLTPKDTSWWNRPILAIAWDVLQTPAKGLGVDRIATGNGFMTPGAGILLQIAEAGMLAARATMEVMTGKNVEAKVDAANSSRAILQSFGELGRVLANFFHGTPRRQTTSAIRDAANEQGVQVVSRTAPSTFAFQRDAALQPELLGAALAFSEANPEDREAAKKRLVSVAQAIYQRAYDRVIDRGGFTNPVEAKDEADRAGQRAVQSAVSSIEPVTRAIGRSVTPDEYAKLKTSGVLENPEVVRETKAVAAAAQALATTPTPTGRAMVNPSQAVTSPISHAGSGGGGFSSGGSSSSTRRPLGRRLPALRSRMPRLRRAPSGRVPRLRKPPKLRRPRL